MTVFRSNKQIYVQLINDDEGKVIASASSRKLEDADQKLAKIQQSEKVGVEIAEKAKAAGIETVVFDRNGYLYHGRVKAVAEAARKGGLKF